MSRAERRLPSDAAVIFDCDGVLVDSEPIVNRVLVERLRGLGISASAGWISEAVVGLSQAETVRLIRQHAATPVPDGWFERLTEAVDEALRREVRPVPGIVDVLDRLTVPYCVASNGRPEKLATVLAASGLDRYFRGRVFTASEVPRAKPAPDLLLLAAARLGVRPERCVVIEDSAVGVAAAVAADMRVLVYAGGTVAAAVPQGGTVFTEMSELPGLLAASG